MKPDSVINQYKNITNPVHSRSSDPGKIGYFYQIRKIVEIWDLNGIVSSGFWYDSSTKSTKKVLKRTLRIGRNERNRSSFKIQLTLTEIKIFDSVILKVFSMFSFRPFDYVEPYLLPENQTIWITGSNRFDKSG